MDPQWAGLSPRRRGNRAAAHHDAAAEGPIPAQAGEPPSSCSIQTIPRAYPRAGGGTPTAATVFSNRLGLSPRRRGNRLDDLVADQGQGPIPAQAGEPRRATCPVRDWCWGGLSPRRRGNQRRLGVRRVEVGPIPAQAGEPTTSGVGDRAIRAYPRAGGGTVMALRVMRSRWGLSPRRRGNLPIRMADLEVVGPIPAQAGEPSGSGSGRSSTRAYPRAGGGTAVFIPGDFGHPGLSPRRRGNRGQGGCREINLGPIPAQAGEPARAPRPGWTSRAYPRAGGGTARRVAMYPLYLGLSPRRRGNRGLVDILLADRGPIPAQAGEPISVDEVMSKIGAYPRAGGGTIEKFADDAAEKGLSPRRRGNHRSEHDVVADVGPIPAQAGEPSATSAVACYGAYPRGRGNRIAPASVGRAYPRAGGGTDWPHHWHAPYPPIPAQAGEPRGISTSAAIRRAYPRAGGGTIVRPFDIPAAAAPDPTWHVGAYPRAGGGTIRHHSSFREDGPYPRGGGTIHVSRKGLSPRRRGNLDRVQPGQLASDTGLSPRRRGNRSIVTSRVPLGPIPAQAGDTAFPWPVTDLSPRRRGNPDRREGCDRGRGPIPDDGRHDDFGVGLSPRRRGNPQLDQQRHHRSGPIPAQAGNHRDARSVQAGLSPRRRGNPYGLTRGLAPTAPGPIPAQAGEPLVTKSLNYWQCQRAGSESGLD